MFSIQGRPPVVDSYPQPPEALPPPPLLCRYLDAPLQEVTRRVLPGLGGDEHKAALLAEIEAATLYRAEISYSIERPPTGPKLIGVWQGTRVLPAQEGGQPRRHPKVVKIPQDDLIRRFVKDRLSGTPVEPDRRIGSRKWRQLMRVRDVYEAAPPRGKAAAVAEAELPHHPEEDPQDRLNAARQLIWEARKAGILERVGTPPTDDPDAFDVSLDWDAARDGLVPIRIARREG
jgi:hypothetical protein